MNNYFSPKFSVSEEVRSTAVALIKELMCAEKTGGFNLVN